ncbi:hypothetical protein ES705_16720 [subsurface metagenome]
MKREVVFTLLLFISALFVNAQIIVTDPELPIADQPVTIYFYSNKEPGALKNFTGDLYTHTGVILEGSSNWMHVIRTGFPPLQMGTMAANLSGYLTVSSQVPYPPILNPVR